MRSGHVLFWAGVAGLIALLIVVLTAIAANMTGGSLAAAIVGGVLATPIALVGAFLGGMFIAGMADYGGRGWQILLNGRGIAQRLAGWIVLGLFVVVMPAACGGAISSAIASLISPLV